MNIYTRSTYLYKTINKVRFIIYYVAYKLNLKIQIWKYHQLIIANQSHQAN